MFQKIIWTIVGNLIYIIFGYSMLVPYLINTLPYATGFIALILMVVIQISVNVSLWKKEINKIKKEILE